MTRLAGWINRVDAFPPGSHLDALPPTSGPALTLHWSGADDPGGVGIAYYDLYVRRDTGSFYLYQSKLDTTALAFTGIPGSTYYFYTIATDRVGIVIAELETGNTMNFSQ